MAAYEAALVKHRVGACVDGDVAYASTLGKVVQKYKSMGHQLTRPKLDRWSAKVLIAAKLFGEVVKGEGAVLRFETAACAASGVLSRGGTSLPEGGVIADQLIARVLWIVNQLHPELAVAAGVAESSWPRSTRLDLLGRTRAAIGSASAVLSDRSSEMEGWEMERTEELQRQLMGSKLPVAHVLGE